MTTADRVLAELERRNLKLKQEKPNHYRCNSPFRPDSDSQAFVVVIQADGEHGAYYDHARDEHGSLYELATRLGVELPTRTPIISTKRAYTGLDDYAAGHGITAEKLKAAGWRETYRENRLALEFTTDGGKRWRFLDGNQPTYKSVQGYQRCWYGLTPTLYRLLSAGQPLVICNGEISTVVAQHYGIAAICLTGGENAIPQELLDKLKSLLATLPVVFVTLDCDDKGRKTAHQIEAQLRNAGFNAKALDLKLGKGGDLADFCSLYGESAAATLTTLPSLSATPTPRKRRIIMPAFGLASFPPVTWIIQGEIPEHGIVTMYSPPGVGKTFKAVDYALRSRVVVVYVAAEGEYGLWDRIVAHCKHYNGNPDKLYIAIGRVDLSDESDTGAFIEEIRPLNPRMVIIDTLARSLGGADENRTSDVNRVIDHADLIRREIDGVVMLVHHTNKNGSVERGSSVIRAASDVMIKLIAQDDLICLEIDKTKDSAQQEPQYFKLLPVLLENGRESRVLVPAANVTHQTPDDPLTTHQAKLLEVLALPVFSDGATNKELVEASDIPEKSIYRVASKLINLGYAQKNTGSRGTTTQITEAGKMRLQHSQDRSMPPNDSGVEPVDRRDRMDRQRSHNPTLTSSLTDHDDPIDLNDLPDPADLPEQLYLIKPRLEYP